MEVRGSNPLQSISFRCYQNFGTVAAEKGLANEVGAEGECISFVFNVINTMRAAYGM